jgi:hypothetical protein
VRARVDAPASAPSDSSSTGSGSTPMILSAEISSNAIDSGLRAVEVTCGGIDEPMPSPSCPK